MSHNSTVCKYFSHQKACLIGGISYLFIIILGIFAEIFVRLPLFIPNNGDATLTNLQSSEFLFRLSIASDITMLIFDILVAWIIYILFNNISKHITLLTVWLRLIHAAVYASIIMALGAISLLINSNQYLPNVANGNLIQLLRDAHTFGYDLGLVFFGLHCVLLGYLINKSDFIPQIIGYLVSAAGIVYLFGSFTRFLAPTYVDMIAPIYVVALVAELSLAIWLLMAGLKRE